MKRILLAALLLFSVASVNAQTEDRPFAFGLWGGSTQYNGDLGQGFYAENGQDPHLHIGLTAAWYINQHFDFSMNATLGTIGYREDQVNNFEGDQFQWNAHMRAYLFKADRFKLNPYALAGVGVSYLSNLKSPGTDFFFPFGIGLKYQLTEKLNLHLQETFAYTDHDNRDNEARRNTDAFLMHSIGITWNFGKVSDADNDGVSDKKDKCPDTPAGVSVDKEGCPLDRDGDGIADYKDACPDVKGVASAKGCPDKDGDSVVDSLDKCIDVPGLVSTDPAINGCPDRDGDGITDADDRCPDVKGTKELFGCVDTDQDGVIDPEDKCPEVKGIVASGGCPEDSTEKGGPKLAPLPVIQPVYFTSTSATLTPEAIAILDNAVKLLKENKGYILEINGHTDNQGTDKINDPLSRSRAGNVRAYLQKKGINGKRMPVRWFGSKQPAAGNDAEETRKFNRRVEFNLITK